MPWKTQRRVYDIVTAPYHLAAAPSGLPGNDDCGSTSVHGIYSVPWDSIPMCPGSTECSAGEFPARRKSYTASRPMAGISASSAGKFLDPATATVLIGHPQRESARTAGNRPCGIFACGGELRFSVADTPSKTFVSPVNPGNCRRRISLKRIYSAATLPLPGCPPRRLDGPIYSVE
ncbi:MAG: hypothetical protein ACLSGF_10310 [Alistipes onderdonkii]